MTDNSKLIDETTQNYKLASGLMMIFDSPSNFGQITVKDAENEPSIPIEQLKWYVQYITGKKYDEVLPSLELLNETHEILSDTDSRKGLT